MTLDLTWFGYGAGIIAAGWFLGTCVAVLFTCLGRLR